MVGYIILNDNSRVGAVFQERLEIDSVHAGVKTFEDQVIIECSCGGKQCPGKIKVKPAP